MVRRRSRSCNDTRDRRSIALVLRPCRFATPRSRKPAPGATSRCLDRADADASAMSEHPQPETRASRQSCAFATIRARPAKNSLVSTHHVEKMGTRSSSPRLFREALGFLARTRSPKIGRKIGIARPRPREHNQPCRAARKPEALRRNRALVGPQGRGPDGSKRVRREAVTPTGARGKAARPYARTVFTSH